jgi:Transposase
MSESRRGILVERWRQRIGEHLASGQSVAAFCRDHGLSENSFYVWKRRLRQGETAPFVEVKTASADAGPCSGIEVGLRGHRRLLVRRGFDRDLLIELIRTLEAIA